MDDRERLRYDRADRMDKFGAKNGADFAAGSRATDLFGQVHQLVLDVDNAKAAQLRARDTGKVILVDALRLDLKDIARTARAIAIGEAGFADAYQMPDNPAEHALLTAGDSFVTHLSAPGVPAKFIAREMSATFLPDLKADLKAIRDYKGDKEDDREDSVEATAAIERLVRLSSQLAQELTSIMYNKYRRANPDKLRAWLSAAHLERMPERKKPDDATGSNDAGAGNSGSGTPANP